MRRAYVYESYAHLCEMELQALLACLAYCGRRFFRCARADRPRWPSAQPGAAMGFRMRGRDASRACSHVRCKYMRPLRANAHAKLWAVHGTNPAG